MFEDVFGGGYGTRKSYAQRQSHDQETPQEHADRVHAEAERLKESQRRKEIEERKRREMMAQAKEQGQSERLIIEVSYDTDWFV